MGDLPELRWADFKGELSGHRGMMLIEVGGPNCAPCVALRPILLQVQKHFQGRMELYELDPETEVEAADHWDVRGVPTLLFLHDGQLKARWVGARSLKFYIEAIERLLADL